MRTRRVVVASICSFVLALSFAPGLASAQCPPPPPTAIDEPCCEAEVEDSRPMFYWEAVETAGWYYIWINKDGLVFHREFVYCVNSWTPAEPLPAGNYRWWVQAQNPCGNSTWSVGESFSVACDPVPAPELNHPYDGTFYSQGFMDCFGWDGCPNANWAQLEITRDGAPFYLEWFEYDFVYAQKSACPSDVDFTSGSYEWRVREWDPCGLNGEWSSSNTFTVEVETCKSAPEDAPKGIEVSTYFPPLMYEGPPASESALRPQICWDSIEGATWYYLQIFQNGQPYLTEWVQRHQYRNGVGAGGNGGICWSAEEDFPGANYWVSVTPWNECGYGPESEIEMFALACEPDLEVEDVGFLPCGYGNRCGIETFLTGSGGGSVPYLNGYGGMSLRWGALPGTSWYQLWINRNGQNIYNEWLELPSRGMDRLAAPSGGGLILEEGYEPPVLWANGDGYIYATPPIDCSEGLYDVWVRSWTAFCGNTEWTEPIQAVQECPLGMPYPIGPEGTIDEQRPVFLWENVYGAQRYRIWLNKDGVKYHEEEVLANRCGSESIEENTFDYVGIDQDWNQDDGWWQLDLPFSFPFCGYSYDTCYVDSNGRITFNYGDSQCCGDLMASFVNCQPMIAALWADLTTEDDTDLAGPSGGGGDGEYDIFVTETEPMLDGGRGGGDEVDSITIRWQGQDYPGGEKVGDVNFSVTLNDNGDIKLSYGEGNMKNDYLVGISAGNGHDYIVSSRSGMSQTYGPDIKFYAGEPGWAPCWDLPLGDYSWWVLPISDCAGEGLLWSEQRDVTIEDE